MKTPINKIVIVGGGSAGWMSAALLSKKFPNISFELVANKCPTHYQYLKKKHYNDKD